MQAGLITLLTPCRLPPNLLLPLQLQREDLAALGNLLLLLACVGRGVPPSLDYLTAHFSREFCHVVAGLLAASEGAGRGCLEADGACTCGMWWRAWRRSGHSGTAAVDLGAAAQVWGCCHVVQTLPPCASVLVGR